MEKSAGKVNLTTTKMFSSRMQASLLLVFCVVTLLMAGLMARLIYIMQVDGDRYAKQVLSRQSYVSAVLPYKRGEILDRKGTVLARSELQYRLILDAKLLLQYNESIAPTLAALKEYFNIDNAAVQTVLQEKPDSHYIILQKNIKYEAVESFKKGIEQINKNNKSEEKVLGVWFEEEYIRSYPYSTLASDVLGFSSADNVGYYGIEEYYNDELNGIDGREYGYYDAELNIERISKKAVNGNSIVSTIDANVQRIVQKHILQFNKDFGSLNIGVLIMNPNNGEILAMASNQEYDLNEPRNLEAFYSEEELELMTEEQKLNALNTLWKNDIISSSFEPGSTFKPLTVAAALEESLANDNSTYFCDGGEKIAGLSKPIRCSNRSGHGQITLGQALMLSCNDALMQIAALEGRDVFYKYEKGFGIGQKTGIDLPGEQTGLIIARDRLNASELATSSFGQSVTVTMMELATAYSSIVNGGYYYQPHIVKEIVSDNGATVKQFDKLLIRQSVSEQTSELIQKYLYQTVEEGTAKGAKVPGYSIGGKTGTAQKLPREAKTYIVSFLGHAPAINPEAVIYVMIDEPQNVERQADSSIATKFASRIMTEALPALGIYPEGDIDYLLQSDDSSQDTNQPGNQNTGVPGENTTGNNTDNEAAIPGDSANNDAANDNSNQNVNNADNEDITDNQTTDENTDNETDDNGTPANNDNEADQTDTQNDLSNENDALNNGNSLDDEFNPDALE
jgi:stage V sporulation protein D (sporulation-specific penicillin-binding protein)